LTKFSYSIQIEASPEKVFAFATDFKTLNEAGKGFQESEYISKEPHGLSSTIHTISWVGKRKSEFDEEAIEFVPNKKVTWRIIGAKQPFKMTSAWIFEPTANGTKLTNSGEYSLPYSIIGILLDKLIVHKDLEKGLIKFQENIKKAIEAK
jgi:uncharacterized protein YndB with AHSA1/START domain